MKILDQFGSDIKITNEIIKGKVICQSFIALTEKISTISVNFATYKRNNSCNVCFEICDNSTGECVFKNIYVASMLRDNSYFNFPVNIDVIKDKKYDLVIYSDGFYGNAVTAKYGKKNHYDDKFVISDEIIDNAELCCIIEYEKQKAIIESNDKKIQGLISVVVPVYNSHQYLRTLFQSISNQTYNNYEIIVVDDGSDNSTETENIVKIFSNLNIKFIKLQLNRGANFARNVGASEAIGEYLFFCDSDVCLDNRIFQKMVQELHSNPDCSWTYCNFSVGNETRTFMNFNPYEMRKRNLCSTMSLLKKKDFCGFRENLKRLQDWDLFLTMMEQGKKGVWINENLFNAKDRPGITKCSIGWSEAVAELKKYHKDL